MAGLLRLEPGAEFAGDYRVVRSLADGGMGAVYIVDQMSTGNQRALKLMHPQLVPPDSLDGYSAEEINVWKTEFDVVSHLRAVSVLEKMGFRIIRQGKHIVMSNGTRMVTIPRHDPVNANTMGGIARDAGLTVEAFRELL